MQTLRFFRRMALPGLVCLTLASSLTSCATVFGGRITDNQKRKPLPGESRRTVRVGALIADILLFPLVSIPVDFATGAIYKPNADGTASTERAGATLAKAGADRR